MFFSMFDPCCTCDSSCRCELKRNSSAFAQICPRAFDAHVFSQRYLAAKVFCPPGGRCMRTYECHWAPHNMFMNTRNTAKGKVAAKVVAKGKPAKPSKPKCGNSKPPGRPPQSSSPGQNRPVEKLGVPGKAATDLKKYSFTLLQEFGMPTLSQCSLIP